MNHGKAYGSMSGAAAAAEEELLDRIDLAALASSCWPRARRGELEDDSGGLTTAFGSSLRRALLALLVVAAAAAEEEEAVTAGLRNSTLCNKRKPK
jgi:hypothetical protein